MTAAAAAGGRCPCQLGVPGALPGTVGTGEGGALYGCTCAGGVFGPAGAPYICSSCSCPGGACIARPGGIIACGAPLGRSKAWP